MSQGTAVSSLFLNTCRQFAEGGITEDQLIRRAVKLGFANVLDTFPNVNQVEIPVRFFVDERGMRNGMGIVVTAGCAKVDPLGNYPT